MTCSTTRKSAIQKLRIRESLWLELMDCLETKSAARRESGAFLLGHFDEGIRVVESFVPYDAVEPSSYERYAVRMTSCAYSKLYAICDERGQRVVADVHAHPRLAFQSPSDRANPMVPLAGHVALIVPNYAKTPVHLRDMTFNVYQGPDKWLSIYGDRVSTYLEIHP